MAIYDNSGDHPGENVLLREVGKAIDSTGDVVPEAFGWLARFMFRAWPDGVPEPLRAFRDGERLAKEELVALGLPKWLEVGRRGWDNLTPKGRLLQDGGYKPTVERVHDRLYWPRAYARAVGTLTDFDWAFAFIRIRAKQGCAASRPLHGREYTSASDLPILPLDGCDRNTCCCNYRHVPRTVAARGG